MKIKYFCPQWGSRHLNFKTFAGMVKDAGYDGIEMSLPLNQSEKGAILNTIKSHGLLYLAQHYETSTVNFEEHKREYRSRLENLATASPVLINSQTGKDFFSFEQNVELINIASEISDKHKVKIVHETHRGKFSFAAHVMAKFIEHLPGLRIGFDVSHWCNVAESFLENQKHNVDLALSRADHIHSRVGFQEGPQIPDPRVPEWEEAVNIHLGWWEQIVRRNKSEGKEIFTVTSEFGPYPYMTILPYTQQAISNQWEINVYMKDLLQSKFASI